MNNINIRHTSTILVFLQLFSFSVLAQIDPESTFLTMNSDEEVETTSICESFMHYAKIAKDFSDDDTLSEGEVVLLTSSPIVKSDEFMALPDNKKVAWIEFMSNASIWGFKNRQLNDFIRKGLENCQYNIARASINLSYRVSYCQGLASVVSEVYPLHNFLGQRNITKEIVGEVIALDEFKSLLLDEAIDYIDENNGENVNPVDLGEKSYRECLIK